jgi:hydrogenase nickel incorporation protein HypB
MCTTCGCGSGQTLIGGHALKQRRHAAGKVQYRAQENSHTHEHVHSHTHDSIDFGTGPAGAHAPGMSQARMVKIERDILSASLRSIWYLVRVPVKPRCW